MGNWYNNTLKIEPNTIVLEREYFDDCTLGTMKFADGFELQTLELPWKDNQSRVSCIPEGQYALAMRRSGVVSRTTGGAYPEGWEVVNVPDRTYIMVHVGNTVDDVLGCILVGQSRGVLGNKKAVLSSRAAFEQFMSKMQDHQTWGLIIKDASA